MKMSAEMLRTLATLVIELKGETFPSHIPGGQVLVQRRAQGVVYDLFFALPPLVLSLGNLSGSLSHRGTRRLY